MITGLGWSQYDEDSLTYFGTSLSFYTALGTAPLITFDISASRIANGLNGVTQKLTDPFTGYDYFAFLDFVLDPGTYFVGIQNDIEGGRTVTANTLGTAQTIPDSYQLTGSGIDSNGADMAFRVFGNPCEAFPGGGVTEGCKPPPNPVPEPSTLALLAAGLLGFAYRRRVTT